MPWSIEQFSGISAETLEEIHAGLRRIAQHLNLPEQGESDQHRIVAAVRHWLETQSEWLLIWDNLEDLDLLKRLFTLFAPGRHSDHHAPSGTWDHSLWEQSDTAECRRGDAVSFPTGQNPWSNGDR